MDCVFCGIVAGRVPASVVYGDDLVVAFCDIEPFTAGHTLVVPRRHAVGLADVDDASAERMWAVGRQVGGAAKAALACPGVNLFLADGAAAWQTVFHVHLHVIPRWGRLDGMRLIASRRRPPRAELDRMAADLAGGLAAVGEPREPTASEHRSEERARSGASAEASRASTEPTASEHRSEERARSGASVEVGNWHTNRRLRLTRRLARQRWFLTMGKLIVPVDTVLQRTSHGRISAMAASGLPHMMLTVTGKRTGQPRRVPLLYVPDGDRFLVIGSNWGKPEHPAWSANLLANPEAVVNLSGREIPVRARLAEGAERARLWAVATAMWPAYDGYATHTDRPLRLFVLERTAGGERADQRS